jgi:hypothetical protein
MAPLVLVSSVIFPRRFSQFINLETAETVAPCLGSKGLRAQV